jgi:hypothetical protein
MKNLPMKGGSGGGCPSSTGPATGRAPRPQSTTRETPRQRSRRSRAFPPVRRANRCVRSSRAATRRARHTLGPDTAEVAAQRYPERPARAPSVACDRLHAIRRPRVRHPDPVHEELREVRLIGFDQPDGAPFCSTAFWTKGGRRRPASALMTLPSRGNASRRASAAAPSSPSGAARCA